jgi:hypothetical protein
MRWLGAPLLVVGLLAAAAASRAELYHWVDAQGVEHYSDRIEATPAPARHDQSDQLLKAAPPTAPASETNEAAPAAEAPRAVAQPPSAPATAPSPTSAPIAPPQPAGRVGSNPSPTLPAAVAPAAGLHFDPAQAQALARRLIAIGVGPILGLALVGLLLSLAFMALAIQLACRIVGGERPGFGRALLVALVQLLAGVGVGVAEVSLLAATGGAYARDPAFQGAQFLLGFGVNVGVLRAMLVERFGRAIFVAIFAALIAAAFGVVLALVFVCGGAGLLAARPG